MHLIEGEAVLLVYTPFMTGARDSYPWMLRFIMVSLLLVEVYFNPQTMLGIAIENNLMEEQTNLNCRHHEVTLEKFICFACFIPSLPRSIWCECC